MDIPPEPKRDIEISKMLSYQLRHNPQLVRDDNGIIPLKKIVKPSSYITDDDIRRIVANCEKQRFSLKEENGVLYIRAQQGYSKNVGEQLDESKYIKKLLNRGYVFMEQL